MLRLLLALTVIQILALGLMAAEMMGLHDEVQRLSAQSTAPLALPSAKSDIASAPPKTTTVVMANEPSLESIRYMVREELAFALADLQQSNSEAAQASRAMDEEESLDRFHATRDAIDAYVHQGRISPQDMTSLQQQIATLNPEQRTQAMRYLVGAMNSGQMDARM